MTVIVKNFEPFIPSSNRDLELIDLLLFLITWVLFSLSLFIYITMSPIIIKHHFFSMWYTNVCQIEHFELLQSERTKLAKDRESVVYHHFVQLASNSVAKHKINFLLVSIECDSESMFLFPLLQSQFVFEFAQISFHALLKRICIASNALFRRWFNSINENRPRSSM